MNTYHTLRRVCCMGALWLMAGPLLWAQSSIVTHAEYFIDNDPGVGNGIAMTGSGVSLSSFFTQISQDIDIDSLSSGMHLVGLRVQNNEGLWSNTFSMAFEVVAMEDISIPPPVYLTRAEYFLDNDPGVGSGAPLIISDGNMDEFKELLQLTLRTNKLSEGAHRLGFRIQNNQGVWSNTVWTVFEVDPTDIGPVAFNMSTKLQQAEYFIDEDPGAGQGIPLLTADGDFDAFYEVIEEDVNMDLLPKGVHLLGIRLQNDEQLWSPVFSLPFEVEDDAITDSLAIRPASPLNFGETPVTTTVTLPLYLVNEGTSAIHIEELATTTPFSVTLEDSVVAAGDSVAVQVSFVPPANVAYREVLHIYSSVGVYHYTVSGTGVAAMPGWDFSWQAHDFDTVEVGFSDTTLLQVQNTGNVPLHLITSVSQDAFAVIDTVWNIPAGQSLDVPVVFTPAEVADYTGTLSINATGLPSVTFPLNGIGAIYTCLDIGTNLREIVPDSPEMPFANLMHMAGQWIATDSVNWGWNYGLIDQIPQDENGYPLELPYPVPGQAGNQFVQLHLVNNLNGQYPAGRYVLLYEGTGTFSFGFDAQVVSTAPGRIELDVNPTDAGIFMQITSSQAGDHVRNVRLLLPGTEATYESNPFNPEFINKLAPFSTIRFNEWGNKWVSNENTWTQWSERSVPTYYSQNQVNGVAYEHMVALCNQTGKNMWINVPYQFGNDDAFLDSLAHLLRDQLDPDLKVYLEYTWEIWRFGSAQNNWVQANGPSELHWADKYAYFSNHVFERFMQVFAGQEDRLVRVVSGLQDNPWVAQASAVYLMEHGSGVDAISTDGYIPFAAEDGLALGDSATVADVFAQMRVKMQQALPNLQSHASFAQEHGLQLLFHEGGQRLYVFYGGESYAQPILEAQHDPEMYNIYAEWLTLLRDSVTGDLLMHSRLVDFHGGNASWGALDNIYSSIADAPKYQALTTYACSQPTVSAPLSVVPSSVAPRAEMTVNEQPETELTFEQQGIKVYPNPFSTNSTFVFTLEKKAPVRLTVHSLTGEVVKTLVQEEMEAGIIHIQWNGENDRHMRLPEGMYLYRFESGARIETGKVLLKNE